MFSHVPWQWRVRPYVTHRLALFHQINSFVDEGGEVGGPAQPDFGRHFVVHPQHVLETPTRALHVQHAAAQSTAPEPYTRGKWEGGEVKGRGAHIQRQSRRSCSIVSPPWKGTNYDNCSVSVSDRQYQAASHPWGDKEEEKERRRKRVDLMSTSGETEKIW